MKDRFILENEWPYIVARQEGDSIVGINYNGNGQELFGLWLAITDTILDAISDDRVAYEKISSMIRRVTKDIGWDIDTATMTDLRGVHKPWDETKGDSYETQD